MGLFSNKEETKVTIKVTGMTCGHCELHVRQALEKVDGVKKALPDRNKEQAVITCTKPVPVESLIEAVTGTGYGAEAIE